MHKLAIFASGGGSNALKIVGHFSDHESIRVALIVSDNEHAGVLQHAVKHNIPTHLHPKGGTADPAFVDLLNQHGITAIVLAGYLKKIPASLIQQYPDSILNIHPALLPAFGGKGMYGMHVHTAVVKAKESQSGMTIHLVNENYDEGRHLFQAICPVYGDDTPEMLASRVLALEHQYFAPVIERYLSSL